MPTTCWRTWEPPWPRLGETRAPSAASIAFRYRLPFRFPEPDLSIARLTAFTPISAFLGGCLIGLAAVALMALNGRIAGISGIVQGAVEGPRGERGWRWSFVGGLVLGALLMLVWREPGFAPRTGYPPALLIAAGLLVGIGTRLGSGCTSGHGVCGIARWSVRSIVATLAFMCTGYVTVYIARHIAGAPL